MNKNGYYAGIDWFRLLAALLVVAIHCSPLAGFSETGDFILTRILARVAVPFFLMTSGFFVLSEYPGDNKRLRAFLKKTGLLYGAAILLYLPLNIYNGYFLQEPLLPNIIKDLIFDGTMYHLWYLPASMLGMVIVWELIRRMGYPKGLAVTLLLYSVGLLGDSYYGLAEKLPVLKTFYALIFEVSDYTRNGLFFAPAFLALGGLISRQKRRLSFKQACGGFLISFVCLFGEAMLLHQNGFQRHDSMYLFLLPCLYFLFSCIRCFRGKKMEGLRAAAMLIYIIHPMMIVMVRAIGKMLHLDELLIGNSLLHYILVCFLSCAVSFAAVSLEKRIPKKPKHRKETERAYIEVDLDHLSHNCSVLQAAMPPGCELMAVVKAEAYGHGSEIVAAHLEKNGIQNFAVAVIEEGIKLRRCGIRGEILILGYTDVHRARELKKYNLSQTLISLSYAEKLNQQEISVKTHIKIDSGMHRLGLADHDSEGLLSIMKMKNLKVTGIFTHLSCCDSLQPEDIEFTEKQIKRFYRLIHELEKEGIAIPKLHIQSSFGLLNYPEIKCDYIRTGIALYGAAGTMQGETRLKLDLRPVLSLKARVVLIRNIQKGESVGYGRTYTAERESRIAILPVGYADGLPRNLSCGRTLVEIKGRYVPLIGRICMDQLAVDITDADDVKVGDIATLIENDTEAVLSAAAVAEQAGTISNELLSRMGGRLPVVIKESSGDFG